MAGSLIRCCYPRQRWETATAKVLGVQGLTGCRRCKIPTDLPPRGSSLRLWADASGFSLRLHKVIDRISPSKHVKRREPCLVCTTQAAVASLRPSSPTSPCSLLPFVSRFIGFFPARKILMFVICVFGIFQVQGCPWLGAWGKRQTIKGQGSLQLTIHMQFSDLYLGVKPSTPHSF